MLPKSHKIIHTHREEEFHIRISFGNTTSSMALYFKGSETPCSEETSLNLSKPAFPEMFGPRIVFVFQNQFLNLKNKTKNRWATEGQDSNAKNTRAKQPEVGVNWTKRLELGRGTLRA